ncbi:hypothetical protein PHPALM_3837 [Phytophthora palmivora]|uniref:Uncharacterized protein n=1 Tax=Phytophthora palmivora TaxID=4796 RepID=A0A2P4YLD6_9STRA|nr:hypothetical protein PHPALM_3837 [Phytophthora palmivora]
MGRSQVKYRSTHGRGRGRGRGGAGEGRGGASGRGRSSHLRHLSSNAYRFEEREVQDDEPNVQTLEDYGGRTQFFASEQNYREQLGATPGEHFQSRAMKQWEEKDDGDAQTTVGVLDLDWIASQLELVSPDIRYRMDPKYCTDLPFEPQDEDEQVTQEKTSAVTPAAASTVAAVSTEHAQDTELDLLLHLSASAAGGSKATSTQSIPVAAVPTSTRTPAETEQLEEWLDDVLDM